MTAVLAIDTASPAGIALAYRAAAAAPVQKTFVPGPQGHSQQLVPTIDTLLGGGKRELSAIAVVTGPGSYAGLRVGIATAESLAMALGIPVYGVTTFEAARAAAPAARAILHPAGRSEYALQVDGHSPALVSPAELQAVDGLAGEGAAAFGGSEVGPEDRAGAALGIAETRLAAGAAPTGLEAFYLREPNITRPRRTPLAAPAVAGSARG